MLPDGDTGAPVPRPQGLYAPARRFGDLIFVSGMTPRRNGELIQVERITAGASPERYREAAELATHNALTAARSLLAAGEGLAAALSLTVYLNTTSDYTEHSSIADFASAVLAQVFNGAVPSRAAVGVASLPGGAPVEVMLIVGVGPQQAQG